MKKQINCILIMVVGFLCLSFQGSEKGWAIMGLNSQYHWCDSISFELEKTGDTCKANIIVGVQKLSEGKWLVFADDINVVNSYEKINIAYYFDKVNKVHISWQPCKINYLKEKKRRNRLNGSFRFLFRKSCNSKGYNTVFCSQPFLIE